MENVQTVKYCQSCGMPMTQEEHFGVNADGSRNEEYCCYCMQNGKLSEATLEQTIDICSDIMLKQGSFASIDAAKAFVGKLLPTLRRWRNTEIKPEIVELPEIVVAGIAANTSNNAPDMNAVMGKLWGDFYGKGLCNQLTGGKPVFSYGVYSDYAKGVEGEYNVTVGVPYSGTIPEGIATKTIPAGTYMRFFVEVKDMSGIGEAWKKIWSMDLNRTFVADFEEYLTETTLYIYIGISK